MNILLIHQHFNTPDSGGPIRSYYLATALVKKGHRVVVITSQTQPQPHQGAIDGVEVIFLAVPYNNRFSFYARAWSFLHFAWSASRAAYRFRHFDVCYAISVPLTVGLSALWLKWRHGMPYWFEVGDLWPDAPIQLGYLRNGLLNSFLFAFERSVYRNAIGVVALSGPIQKAIEGKVPGCRVELISNMADCDFYFPHMNATEAALRFSSTGKFVVSYIGTLGMANGLDHLIRCAEESQRSGLPIQFLICGDGAMLDALRETARNNSLSNVIFTGFLNREAVREVLAISDAVLVSYRPAPILETGCPNKYFDGLAAGKLILVNFGGWIRQEVETRQCGIYINPADANSFSDKLGPYLSDKSLLAQTQERARKLAEEKYARTAISERFAALIAS